MADSRDAPGGLPETWPSQKIWRGQAHSPGLGHPGSSAAGSPTQASRSCASSSTASTSSPPSPACLQDQGTHALREAATAREQLGRPFKYAEQLADAYRKQERIGEQVGWRHARAGQPNPPGADDHVEPETTEALRLLRPTQARPVEEALHPPSMAPAARPYPAHDTSRGDCPGR